MKNIYLILLIILCLFAVGCENPMEPFFPDNIFSEKQDLNNFKYNWYTGHLSALGEPSIYQLSKNKDMKVFRFTLLPSFDHPIAARIVINQDGTGILYAKMTDGKGGYDAGKISKTVQRKVNKGIVKDFLNVIEAENFWQLPTNKEVLGLDGDQWIVEGLSNGHYHLVDRWSPDKGSVRIIGSYFLKLSGFDKFQYDKMISRFSNVIELNPRNDKAYQYRGAAYGAKGEYNKAISDFNKAIELNSKNADAYNGKAWILATCRDAEYRDGAKAVELAKRAVEISPKGNFFDTLAAAYAEIGKFEDAIKKQEKAIAMIEKEGKQKT